jgi:hypothetical protein
VGWWEIVPANHGVRFIFLSISVVLECNRSGQR